jgi:hypothetical protein
VWVDVRGDPELAPLKDVLDSLGTARVLTVSKAAAVLRLSPSAVRSWCVDETPPVPHDHRPGKRPSRLMSEADLFRYVLDRPSVRDNALAVLRGRVRHDLPPPFGTPPRGSAANPTPLPPADEPDAHGRSAGPTPRRSAAQAGQTQDEHEAGRLRGEVVRLQEQVAHLTQLIEELEASNGRKSALWVAALRATTVPANAQALDGLAPPPPPD